MAEKFSVLIKYKYVQYINNAKISGDDAWELLKGIIEYDKTGTEPMYKNPVLYGLFAVIKSDLDKNRENWEAVSKERSKAGTEGAKKRWSKGKNINDSNCHENIANMANDSNCHEKQKNIAKMHDLDLDSVYIDSDLKIDTGSFSEPPLSESQKSAIELSDLLLTSHRKEFPDYLSGKNTKEITERWAEDIEKLIRIDKKSSETIRQVILWVKTNSNFWFHNIESGKKLREKFERLYGQMTSEKTKGSPRHRIAADNVSQEKVSSYFREAK